MNSTKIIVRKDASTLASLLLKITFRNKCGQFREPQQPRLLVARHRDGKADRSSPRFIPGCVFQAKRLRISSHWTSSLYTAINNHCERHSREHYGCTLRKMLHLRVKSDTNHISRVPLTKPLNSKFSHAKFWKLMPGWICIQIYVSLYTLYEVISRLLSPSKFLL